LETKEQFSDGVGYGWIDKLKSEAAVEVTDEQLASAKFRFRCRRLLLREYYYRAIFHEHFPSDAALCVPQEASVACSTKSH
jgi:asparagine synthase (glutamine-hydrolysing)